MFKILWVDEVWRGAWAWPVVAWACLFDGKKVKKYWLLEQLKDSKKLTKKRREEIYKILIDLEKKWICFLGIWIKDNNIIDKIWIKKANKLAMEDAITEIFKKLEKQKISFCDIEIKIDWNDKYVFENFGNKTTFIIKWDNLIDEIKAASIFAKVTRDEIMSSYWKKYLWYSLEDNVWYWTKKHMNWLIKLWITSIHRKSYKPIKNILIMRQNSIL